MSFVIRTAIKKKAIYYAFLISDIIIVVFSFFQLSNYYSLSLLWFILLIPVSYLLYIVSNFIVGTPAKKIFVFLNVFSLDKKNKQSFFKETLNNIISSSIEEVIYRGILWELLSLLLLPKFFIAIITAMLFFLVHLFRKIYFVQAIDILLFSIFITAFMYLTNNLFVIIAIHFLRNIHIIIQNYSEIDRRNKRIRNIIERVKGKTKS